MRILFIGDIVGAPGATSSRRAVPQLIAERQLDLVVANAENAAGGSGLTPDIYKRADRRGRRRASRWATTSTAAARSSRSSSASRTSSARPTCPTRPSAARGRRSRPATARWSASFSLLGQLYMRPVDSPFRAADRVLAAMPADVRVRLVDFHAEATSEAQTDGPLPRRPRLAPCSARTPTCRRPTSASCPAARRFSATWA